MIADLLDHRLLLVTGKGGVGKSSVAAGLALAAHAAGRRVLVAEVDTDPVMPALLSVTADAPSAAEPGADRLDGEPVVVREGVSVVNLDHTGSVVAYLREHLPIPRLLRAVVANPVIGSFLRAAPSVTEMAILSRLHVWVEAMERGEAPYDLLVVDLPALGHAYQMLEVPTGLGSLVRIGPAAERAAAVDRLLHDAQRCALVLVTLPEEMPVTETVQFGMRLGEELGLGPRWLVVNQVMAPLLEAVEGSSKVLRSLTRLLSEVGPVRPDGQIQDERARLGWLLNLWALRDRRARSGKEQVARLKRKLPGVPTLDLPLLWDAPDGPQLVEALATHLDGGAPR